MKTKQTYPLSHPQKRLWLEEEMYPNTPVYNIGGFAHFELVQDFEKLVQSIDETLLETESIWFKFSKTEDGHCQYLDKNKNYKSTIIQILDDTDGLEKINVMATASINIPFILEKQHLFQSVIYQMPNNQVVLFLKAHHMVLDGWSLSLFFNTIVKKYLAKNDDRPVTTTYPYIKYMEKENDYLNSKRFDRDKAYLMEKMSSAPVPISLSNSINKKNNHGVSKGKKTVLVFSADQKESLRKYCQNQNATLFQLYMTVISLCVYKHSGERDFCLGTILHNRFDDQLKHTMGTLVSTCPLASNIPEFDDSFSFSDYLKIVKKEIFSVLKRQRFPYDILLNEIKLYQRTGQTSLFNILINYRPMKFLPEIDGHPVKVTNLDSNIVRNEMEFIIVDRYEKGDFELQLKYSTEIFSDSEVEQIIKSIIKIIEEVAGNPDFRPADLSLADAGQMKQIAEFNNTEKEFNSNITLQEMFEKVAGHTPEKIALEFEGEQLTYLQLNEKANQLANYLIENFDPLPDTPIGLSMPRSIEMVIGILGIIKAGGAYVPIDPRWPDLRKKNVLNESKAITVIEHGNLTDLSGNSKNNPRNRCHSGNLAYIIFTSGTTGVPKGAMIEHSSVVNRIEWMKNEYQVTTSAKILQKTSFTFDVSVWEFFLPLCYGATLSLADIGAEKYPEMLLENINNYKITMLHFVPTMLTAFVSFMEVGDSRGASLIDVIASGEALSPEIVNRFYQKSNANLQNLYGPTEATVDVTYFQTRKNCSMIPIGRPIDNTKIYILDRQLKIVPIGFVGEIYLAGAGIGRGYINNLELTAKTFLSNPYSGQPMYSKMYKTGDRGRWHSDGNIEYLGRVDQQIKIRGLRVELEEIENALQMINEIINAIVSVHNNQIIAYYDLNSEISISRIKSLLNKFLPDYMIPVHFVHITDWPRTTSGKISKKMLPIPNLKCLQVEYVAPASKTEKVVTEVVMDVLSVSTVSVTSDFFELGGDSIKAIQVVSRLKNIGQHLQVQDIFNLRTIKKISGKCKEMDTKVVAEVLSKSISKCISKKIFPVNPMQEGMVFYSELVANSPVYFEQLTFIFKGTINLNKLKDAINLSVKKHPVMRATFVRDATNNSLIHKIHDQLENKFEMIDLNSNFDLNKYLQDDVKKGFDLEIGPLFRIAFIHNNEKTIIVWAHHHVILDGWSFANLWRDIFEIFHKLVNNQSINVVADYSFLNHLENKIPDYTNSTKYWQAQLENYENVSSLPKLKTINRKMELIKKYVVFTRPELNQIETFAAKNRVTVNVLLKGVWAILLSRYNNTNDVVFGSTYSGRDPSVSGIEDMIGLFISTVPSRIKISEEERIVDWLGKLNIQTASEAAHSDLPLQKIFDLTSLEKNIFDHLWVYENYPIDASLLEMKGTELQLEEIKTCEMSNYDLTIVVFEEQGCKIEFQFAKGVFHPTLMENVIRHYQFILKQIVNYEVEQILEIELQTENEKTYILEQFNFVHPPDYNNNLSAKELFERQVMKTPDSDALYFDGKIMTYQELNQRANCLAWRLRKEYQIGPNMPVGIFIDRSFEMIISVLAVLKAGAGYVPISTEYPDDRIDYMLVNTKMVLLLTETKFLLRLKNIKANKLCLDSFHYDFEMSDNLPEINTMEDLVYVIYTSGSTGKPKGVMQNHRSVCNMLLWKKYHSGINHQCNILFFTSISFDVSFEEIFTALITGGKLFIVPEHLRNEPVGLAEYIRDNKINLVSMPYSYINLLFQQGIPETNLLFQSDVKYIIHGGEPLKIAGNLKSFLETKEDVIFHNNYGPSETHMITSYNIDITDSRNLDVPPIGRPLTNCRIYILDDKKRIMPIMAPGEIYIGGEQVGPGYFGSYEMTKERFIPDPFHQSNHGTMYRTGDLARFLPDGNIEYLSRADEQIKIRGNRVEIGEVELALAAFQNIIEQVVVVRNDKSGNAILVAFYSGSEKIESSALRDFLGQTLPDYMIPSFFIRLDSIPKTPNGKTDRRQLPELNEATDILDYQAPRNELEEALVELFKKVANIDKIGINNTLFDLGVHSIMVMKLSSEIFSRLKIKIPFQDILNNPTVRQIAEIITRQDEQEIEEIPLIGDKELYPLSHSQKRIWTQDQLDSKHNAYNISAIYKITGQLDLLRLQEAIDCLLDKYEIFRTAYIVNNEEGVMQKILFKVDFKIKYEDYSKNADKDCAVKRDIFYELHHAFDLTNPPHLRVVLIKEKEKEYTFIITFHHIVTDEWSLDIILEQLKTIYEGGERHNSTTRCLQYRDYAVWEKKYLASELANKHKAFWINKLAGDIPRLDLEKNNQRSCRQTFTGKCSVCMIDSKTVNRVKSITKDNQLTPFSFWISTIYTLIYKVAGENDIVLGTPTVGRDHPGLNSMPGCFINILALRHKLSPEKNIIKICQEVKDNILESFEHQTWPFDKVVEALGIPRDNRRSPIFDIMISFQGKSIVDKEQTFNFAETKWNKQEQFPEISKYDLSFYFFEKGDVVELLIEYNTDIYTDNFIENLKEYYQVLVSSLVFNPEDSLSEHLITDECVIRKLKKFNQTLDESINYNRTLSGIFKETANRFPDKVALYGMEEMITYNELDNMTDRIASYLKQNYGITRNIPVAIKMDRSPQMIMMIVAIIKAGGAYVPIAPNTPKERVNYIIEDSNARFLIDDDWDIDQLVNNIKIEVLETGEPDDLVYVMYTSGSTGNPKGVMIEQRSIINMVECLKKDLRVTPDDIILQKTNNTFDASAWEIFVPLCCGQAMAILPQNEEGNPEAIVNFIDKYKVTMAHFVPTMLDGFLENIKTKDIRLSTLKHMIVGGEPLSLKIIKSYYQKSYGFLHNFYGPTETTVYVTYYTATPEDNLIHIGKPIGNTHVYILDKHQSPIPIGAVGEICISGVQVGRGYVNNKELTRTAFIKSPIGNHSSFERVYRTGDLGKFLPDGNIEFVGRVDNQVKIRGHRIELGDIETVLISHSKVERTLVDTKKQDNKELELVVYLQGNITHDELVEYLRSKLPKYMIPVAFYLMDEWPKAASSGKTDRKALRQLQGKLLPSDKLYHPPQNSTQEKVIDIFTKVLGIDNISILDDFFDIGGTSLKALRVISLLKREYDIDSNLIFTYPNAKTLSTYLLNSKAMESITDKIHRLESKLNRLKELKSKNNNLVDERKEYKKKIKPFLTMKLDETINYNNILITGATGFLGIHILFQLLTTTDAKISLFVRGQNVQQAKKRFKRKFEFYFPRQYGEYESRITIFCADLSKELPKIPDLDCIIHSAANVSHYGPYKMFHQDNVLNTQNLLEYAIENKIKHFHHISTRSVGEGTVEGKQEVLFTEFDVDIKQNIINSYVKSKHQAEKLALQYRKRGLVVNLYRAGNIVFNTKTGKQQENIEDNAFNQLIKTLEQLKMIPDIDVPLFDFSYVDKVAEFFTVLFNKKSLENNIFHLNNWNEVGFLEIAQALKLQGSELKLTKLSEIVQLLENVECDENRDAINLIYDRVNEALEVFADTLHLFASEKTCEILKRFDLSWPLFRHLQP